MAYLGGMTSHSFALFDTAIGGCAIVWTARGIAGVDDVVGGTWRRVVGHGVLEPVSSSKIGD